KKPVKNDLIEDFVVDYTMNRVLADDAIEEIADIIMDLQNQDNKIIPALRKQLADTEKGIQNILDAIQNGMFHASLTERLDNLEEERKKIKSAIAKEELQRSAFSRSEVVFWISQFKFGNPDDMFFRQRLIDTFVNSIYLYDDNLVITYNFKDGIRTVTFDEANEALDEAEKHSSDKENVTSPRRSKRQEHRVMLKRGSIVLSRCCSFFCENRTLLALFTVLAPFGAFFILLSSQQEATLAGNGIFAVLQ
ncbi:MAG: hypothetical protein IJD14_05935, partial [Christensenellaceae bacterium]|nr:hypothetical protein [Christensenellaceae bacterium]